MDPIAKLLPTSQAPAAPEGLTPSFIWNEDGTFNFTNSAVLVWQGYTYWTYDFRDNRDAFLIIAYDSDGNEASRWEMRGIRHIYKISIHPEDRNVAFWGQQDHRYVMYWDELDLNRTL